MVRGGCDRLGGLTGPAPRVVPAAWAPAAGAPRPVLGPCGLRRGFRPGLDCPGLRELRLLGGRAPPPAAAGPAPGRRPVRRPVRRRRRARPGTRGRSPRPARRSRTAGPARQGLPAHRQQRAAPAARGRRPARRPPPRPRRPARARGRGVGLRQRVGLGGPGRDGRVDGLGDLLGLLGNLGMSWAAATGPAGTGSGSWAAGGKGVASGTCAAGATGAASSKAGASGAVTTGSGPCGSLGRRGLQRPAAASAASGAEGSTAASGAGVGRFDTLRDRCLNGGRRFARPPGRGPVPRPPPEPRSARRPALQQPPGPGTARRPGPHRLRRPELRGRGLLGQGVGGVLGPVEGLGVLDLLRHVRGLRCLHGRRGLRHGHGKPRLLRNDRFCGRSPDATPGRPWRGRRPTATPAAGARRGTRGRRWAGRAGVRRRAGRGPRRAAVGEGADRAGGGVGDGRAEVQRTAGPPAAAGRGSRRRRGRR